MIENSSFKKFPRLGEKIIDNALFKKFIQFSKNKND